MRIGLGLPQLGTLAEPRTLTSVAVTAEAAGFSSLWAVDRLLAPIVPRSAYPGSADGSLPVEQQRVLDPLVALTTAAAVTERIGIGTNVLVAPWYPAPLLARSLASLDHVSGGRLTVGLGLGWSVDEYEAVGVPMRQRALILEETIETMAVLWRDDVCEIETTRGRIAKSVVDLKPVQRPRPRLLLATFNPTGMERVARRADGWLSVGLPWEMTTMIWGGIRDTASRYGRDTDAMELVVRADPLLTDSPLGDDRPPFWGTLDQVVADVERAREVGAAELILDLNAAARNAEELMDLASVLTAGQLSEVSARR